MSSGRRPGQRAGLTRAAVLEAAREVVTQGGAGALTMRALAHRLNVAPNALYSHVPSRNALVDELLDDLLASIPAPAPVLAHDPVASLLDLMRSTYAVLTAHPDLVPLYLARQGARGPHAVRLGLVMDTLLASAGVHQGAIAAARRVLIVHTIGSAAFATGASPDADTDRPLAPEESRRTFSRSLRWLLAGIVNSRGVDDDEEADPMARAVAGLPRESGEQGATDAGTPDRT